MELETRPQTTTGEVIAASRSAPEESRVHGLEVTLRRRDAVLAAVYHAASRFLQSEHWDRDVRDILGRLGTAAEVNGVFLFESHEAAEHALCATLRHQWVADSAAAPSADTTAGVPLGPGGLGRWLIERERDPIHGGLDLLEPGERFFFSTLGVRSLAVVPVFAGERWWGYLSLPDSANSREWSQSLLDALRAAAAALGSAIYRHQSEDRLRQSEQRFRQLSEAAVEGVFIHVDGIIQEANPAFGRLFGYDVQELIGTHVLNLIPDHPSRETLLWHHRTGSTATYEVSGQRRDGSVLVAEVTSRITSHEGREARVVTVHDVTARRDVEAALHRRESQLSQAQAIAHMGSWYWDIRTNAVTASEEMSRIYGFGPDELPTTGAILARSHPDDADVMRRTLDDAVQNGRDFTLEHRVIRAPNDIRTVRSQGRVVFDEGGRPRSIVGASHDITERREAELVALRLAEEQVARAAAESEKQRAAFLAEASRVLGSSFDYQTTLASLTRLAIPMLADYCTVDVLGPDGRIERVGAAHVDPGKEPLLWEVAKWFRTGDEMAFHFKRALLQGLPTIVPVIDEALIAGTIVSEEHARILALIHPRSGIAVPLKVSDRVLGVMVMYVTESARRYNNDDLALAEELARRAALAVENARLYSEARQATQARDQMLGIVAHDLRNPLGTILMATQLMSDTLPADAPARKQVAMVQRAGDRMNRLIQDLLDVKRMENGRLPIDARPVDLGVMLREAAEMLRPLATGAALEMQLDAPDAQLSVIADPQRIQQVLSNLVGNAIKFTPRGGRITISGQRTPTEARVAVTDTGPGIAADQLPHIFGQFWQGSRTDRRGIGLGLSIAKGIVEAHSGRIWVESVPGAGSSFYFTLPLAPAVTPAANAS